ncbi:MAG: NAD(+)/NADH kinase [Candidatus Paceibacterota bacterium]
MKIAIFYNSRTNPKHRAYATEISKILDRYNLKYFLNPSETDFKKIELAITAGGDGTVLYAANLLAKFNVPILGINFGHRGFLCEVQKKENIEEVVKKIVEGDYKIEEKTRIQAEIKKQDKSITSLNALNEISIGGINRTVYLSTEISIGKKSLKVKIVGDGLIVATRTGSTAYNINAGGPMLLTEALSVVANNAFFESSILVSVTRSLVVPSETIIRVNDLSHNADNLPFVIADGQKSLKIGKEDIVIIKKAKERNYFMKF